MPKVCIDSGHGGKDSGAVLGTRYEKNDALKMALAVSKLLEQQGIEVILTRDSDKDMTLAERTSLANKENCDYFLSIHRNSYNASSTGIEIWVYSKATQSTCDKAQCILDNLLSVTSVSNRGLKKGYVGNSNVDYAVNRDTNMASALLELLFISNPNDNAIFDVYFKEYALAIAKGICNAVGVTYKENTEINPNVIYRVQVGAFSNKENAEKYAAELKSKGINAFVTT